MRKVFCFVVFMLLGFWFPLRAASIELFADCQQSVEGGVKVYLGYSASDDVVGTSEVELSAGADVFGALPSTFEAGEHHRVFGVILLDGAEAHWTASGADFNNTLTIRGDMDVPTCTGDDWHPDAPSIPIVLESDCAFVETRDYLNGQFTGHWSRVTSNGQPVLLHYGQALIGSSGQSTKSDDYRAVETPCY